ncbi:MAG TPA: arsenite methyltransferase [Thermomicrobiales bacterium]|nr:arsenite methyltransferase [Thermomicrobiales bacterium]
MSTTTNGEPTRETVREHYAAAAMEVSTTSGGCCLPDRTDPITSNLYTADELASLPQEASLASLGCGNPTALTILEPGETVLDLGSGGGIDVLLSARRVGPDGFAYGLDMTDEMLALAERNKARSELTNVEFLKGHIEAIPLAECTVEVVISNCVINLSTDKGQVLREAFRVLRPGGRFAVSDVVTRGELPADLRVDMEAWIGCVAGALDEEEYRQLLADAGFENVEVQVTRVYDPRELIASLGSGSGCCGGDERMPVWSEADLERLAASGGQVMSAFVRAHKPSAA